MIRLTAFLLAFGMVASLASGAPPDPGEHPGLADEDRRARDEAPNRTAGEPGQEPDEDEPPSWSETVVVTASRSEEALVESVALVTSFDSGALTESPAGLLDETLGRVPGFGLFRRNSSLISHPTTTGVSLRGIGPSGASRTLVLWDGLPLNDPFGNWVYWNRLPTLFLDRVEVARGAASPLYGSSALGGAVQLLSRRPEPGLFRARGRFGNQGIRDGEVVAAHEAGDTSVVGAARVFRGEGYHRIREAERGSVDEPAGVDFESFVGRAGVGPVQVSVNYYAERRRNGTPVQVNDSRLVMAESGITREDWRLRVFGQTARLNSDFSRILPGRDEEIPTSQQMYEYSGLGGVFVRDVRERHQAGADWVRSAWGEHAQNRVGAFWQTRWEASPDLEMLADLRSDIWQNAGTKASLNPRLGMNLRLSPQASLRASGYRGFRAPSLNELYRPFRVGNVRVAANDELGEETLYGAEAGFDLYPSPALLLRGNLYWNSLRDTVGNVTLEVTDEGVFRQRQNIGRATARGFEAEAYLFPDRDTEIFASYLFSATSVADTGLRLPQVPLHQGAVGVAWSGPVRVRADLRFLSEQFEDDRNELPMAGFASVGLRISWPVNDRFGLFVAGENLLDAEIVSARTPIETLGSPRALHLGVDLDLSP